MTTFENPPEQRLAGLLTRRVELLEAIEQLYRHDTSTLLYQHPTFAPRILLISPYELTVARYDREIAALERQLGIENPRDPEPKPAYDEEEVD